MDETTDQIEAHIDRTRERLGSNLRELEDRVEAAREDPIAAAYNTFRDKEDGCIKVVLKP